MSLMFNGGSEKDEVILSQEFDRQLKNHVGKDSVVNFDKILSVVGNESLTLVTDINGVIVFVNEKCSALLGYKPNELIGKQASIFRTGLHSKEFYLDLWETILAGKRWNGEISAKMKNGSVKWFLMDIIPLLNDFHQPDYFLSIRTDITHFKEIEKQALIKDKEFQSFSGILTNSALGVINQNGKILALSPAVREILGYKVSERIGASIYDHIDPDDLSDFKMSIEGLKKVPGSKITKEINMKSKSGSKLTIEMTLKNYLHDPILKSIIFTYHDITEQKRLHEELINAATYDILTKLPNYHVFECSLDKEIENANENNTSFAVVQLGLDNFKYIKSAFGHSGGDQLLRDFSKRVRHYLAENTTMFRMAGDIFLLLIKDAVDEEIVSETLNQLRSLINKVPFHIQQSDAYVSVSMGVSIFPYTGENKEELTKNAEIAMFRAKSLGKNQIQFFSPTMDAYSYKQYVLRNDLKNALLQNEFSVYYQPRVNPFTEEIVSAEALIRWEHPKWGLVLPDEFISMAEDSGLILQIGEWIIRQVSAKLVEWEKEHVNIKKVSINVSALQVLQPNFVDMVSSILNDIKINSKWIELEITESTVLDKEEEVLNTLNQIKNLGITIALDDFGTGYSSLNYLKKFPYEIVKIDKSLIDEIHKDPYNYEIIASIITLCHKLKRAVVAEGVETTEQLAILKQLHCDEIQGYLYSKPVDEQQFKKLLKRGVNLKQEKSSIKRNINRRKYFRIQLEKPLTADMTIGRIGSRNVHLGNTEVIVKNIGPGGLCFYSPLKLPVSNEILLKFALKILSEEIKLNGNVVWYKETNSKYFQYGIQFILDNTEQENLIRVLNNLQIKLKKNSLFS